MIFIKLRLARVKILREPAQTVASLWYRSWMVVLLGIKQRPVNESAEIAEISIAAMPQDAVRVIVSGAPLLGQAPRTVLEFVLSE